MGKFIFENAEEISLSECSDEQYGIISRRLASGDNGGLVQIRRAISDGDNWRVAGSMSNYTEEAIFRVLAKPYALEDAILDMERHFEEGRINTNLSHVPIEIIRKLAASMGGGK